MTFVRQLERIPCLYFLPISVVSIKRTGCNKRTGWADFFDLLHEKRVQGGAKIFLLHEKWDQGGAKTSK